MPIDERLLILQQEPTFLRETWLPGSSPWPELNELHADHVRLLDARAEAAAEVGSVRRRHEAEDETRREALTVALREGRDADDLPAPTPAAEREAELHEGTQRWEAASYALAEFIHEALDALNEHAEEWLGDLGRAAADAERKREEARRLLAEADEAVRTLSVLDMWVRRSSGRAPRGHFPFGEMPVPPAERVPNLAALMGDVDEPEEEAVPEEWREDLDPIEPASWRAAITT